MSKKKKVIIAVAAAFLLVAIVVAVILIIKSNKKAEGFQLESDYSYEIEYMEDGSAKLTLGKKGCKNGTWTCETENSDIVDVSVENGSEDIFTITGKTETEKAGSLRFILNDGEKDIYSIDFFVASDETGEVDIKGVSAAEVYDGMTIEGENGLKAECSSRDTGYLAVVMECDKEDKWEFSEIENTIVEPTDWIDGSLKFMVHSLKKGEYTVEISNVTKAYTVQLDITSNEYGIVQILGGKFIPYVEKK